MDTIEMLQRLDIKPDAFQISIGLPEKISPHTLTGVLTEKVSMTALNKFYSTLTFLHEVAMDDVAFDLIEAMFSIADIALPSILPVLMTDEEFAHVYVGRFLSDYRDCLDNACQRECGSSIGQQDGEMSG